MAAIIAFRHPRTAQNWTNEELAELYRVVDILNRAGVPIDTDMGLSDEGEPWFAFCRKDTCDVIVHFSRIDGQFVAVSATTSDVVRGRNFRRVAEALVNRQPLILPAPTPGQKLFLHPAVILTALVATTLAQMKSWDGQEVEVFDDAVDGDLTVAADAGFTETLKTAFLDAMNFVVRGIPGPAALKNGLTETGQTAAHHLGGLSLASVLAFAISVTQGSPLPHETDVARRISPSSEGSDATDANNVPVVAAAPQDADTGTKAQDAGGLRLAENKEPAVVKAMPRDGGSITKVDKVAGPEKSDAAVSNDESFARHEQKELADKLQPAAPVADNIKLASAESPVATKPAEQPQQILIVPDEPQPARAEISATTIYHQFNFTEISKEALEFFFAADSDDQDGVAIAVSTLEPSNLLGENFSAAPASRTALNASDIVFAGGDPVAMSRLNLITDFVNSSGAQLSAPAILTDAFNQYWAGDKMLTVVVFDSEDLPLDIFSFTSNVLFVEESQLAGLAVNFNDNALQVELANGGDVTLLGVINLDPVSYLA